MILVLSDKFDKHADLVCDKLSEQGADFFRSDLDVDSLMETYITFHAGVWIVNKNSREVSSDAIKCVWVRRTFVEVSLEETNLDDPSFKIWRGEWNKTLLGLYNSLKSKAWLNPLAKAYQAENKYLQMEFAEKVGFLMPPIIISNKKELLLDFAEKHGNVVLKMMNQDFYKDHDGKFKGLYVNQLTINDLNAFEDCNENPIVLQAYINKLYEVRYTIVGEEHHVCRIESQKSKLASVDWRRYDIPNTPHYSMQPPEEIKTKVSNFMSELGLNFGAMDFIVSSSDQW